MLQGSLRRVGGFCFVFAFATACGGSVVNQKSDDGSGGSGAIGGSVGNAGSSSAGMASVGGGANCDAVMCEPVMACGAGYELKQPAGACCQGCIPEAGQVACPKIACPRSTCQLGYVRGDLVGGCCTECVPDALFCNDDSECVVADRPRSCCGCPEIISLRAYDADSCWSAVDAPRPIPKSCYPQVVCDAFCGQCPAPPSASCQNHRCLDIGLK